MGRVGPSFFLTVVAWVVFILATFGVTIGSLTELREVALGLMFFAAAHLVP